MLIRDKKHFILGLFMLIVFAVVLVLMSLPLFEGRNAFDAADDLYNSIAKGSSYKIPELKEQARALTGTVLDCAINTGSVAERNLVVKMAAMAGITLSQSNGTLRLQGDLSGLALAALQDADLMYFDREDQITKKYGLPGRQILFTWWHVLKEIRDTLKRNKVLTQAAFLDTVVKKGIEVGYNFSGIAPEKVSSKAGTLIVSLVFYVCYTIWWGFSIFFLFEGFGLAMEAGKKEEM
jgi:hypothetical protein